jgi:hypothetical protein
MPVITLSLINEGYDQTAIALLDRFAHGCRVQNITSKGARGLCIEAEVPEESIPGLAIALVGVNAQIDETIDTFTLA